MHYATLQVQRIIDRVEKVAKMPTLGHPVHEKPMAGLREVHEGSYRIIYRYNKAELAVVTVVHMKQLLKSPRLK